MKSALWYGVFTPSGTLLDCTPGFYHAQEIAADAEKTTQRRGYVVAAVLIVPEPTHEPEAAASAPSGKDAA